MIRQNFIDIVKAYAEFKHDVIEFKVAPVFTPLQKFYLKEDNGNIDGFYYDNFVNGEVTLYDDNDRRVVYRYEDYIKMDFTLKLPISNILTIDSLYKFVNVYIKIKQLENIIDVDRLIMLASFIQGNNLQRLSVEQQEELLLSIEKLSIFTDDLRLN